MKVFLLGGVVLCLVILSEGMAVDKVKRDGDEQEYIPEKLNQRNEFQLETELKEILTSLGASDKKASSSALDIKQLNMQDKRDGDDWEYPDEELSQRSFDIKQLNMQDKRDGDDWEYPDEELSQRSFDIKQLNMQGAESCDSIGCRTSDLGTDYTGSQHIARNGLNCLSWNGYPGFVNKFGMVAGDRDYCRNPKNRSGGLWCYTQIEKTATGSRFFYSYCDVPLCGEDADNTSCDSIGCRTTDLGRDYKGTQHIARQNRNCLTWDSNPGFVNKFGMVAGDRDYCRNPKNRSGGLWCYTRIEKTATGPRFFYSYCDVPLCDEGAERELAEEKSASDRKELGLLREVVAMLESEGQKTQN